MPKEFDEDATALRQSHVSHEANRAVPAKLPGTAIVIVQGPYAILGHAVAPRGSSDRGAQSEATLAKPGLAAKMRDARKVLLQLLFATAGQWDAIMTSTGIKID